MKNELVFRQATERRYAFLATGTALIAMLGLGFCAGAAFAGNPLQFEPNEPPVVRPVPRPGVVDAPTPGRLEGYVLGGVSQFLGYGDFDYQVFQNDPADVGLDLSGTAFTAGAGFDVAMGAWRVGPAAIVHFGEVSSQRPCRPSDVRVCSAEHDIALDLRVNLGRQIGKHRPFVFAGGTLAFIEHEVVSNPSRTPQFAAGDVEAGWLVGAGYRYDVTDSLFFQVEADWRDYGTTGGASFIRGANEVTGVEVTEARVAVLLGWGF